MMNYLPEVDALANECTGQCHSRQGLRIHQGTVTSQNPWFSLLLRVDALTLHHKQCPPLYSHTICHL